METSNLKHIAIVSDLHLKHNHDQDWERFLSLLESWNRDSSLQQVWMLGDVFDVLIGSFSFWRKIHGEVFARLRKLHNQGIRVLWIEGNHDFHFSKLAQSYGIELRDQTIEEHISSSIPQGSLIRTHLAHGDLVNLDDKAYLKWRAFTRSKIFHMWIDSLIEPFAESIVLPLALKSSQQSRRKTAHYLRNNQEKLRQIYRQYAQKQFQSGHNAVILGHCHVQDLYVENQNFYLNMGSWIGDPLQNPRRWAQWTPGQIPKIIELS